MPGSDLPASLLGNLADVGEVAGWLMATRDAVAGWVRENADVVGAVRDAHRAACAVRASL